jgi:zinc transporter 9
MNHHTAGKVSGLIPVILALLGNAFITIIKFVGFSVSGSGAMFSEAIHSLADTLNQGLLFIGLKNSTKIADHKFSYGYGKERFFWALISACGIFFLGAGVTIYHGIELLSSHEVPHIHPFIFGILGISFVIEIFTFIYAVKELRSHHKGYTFPEMLAEGDPTTIAVIYEDGAAVLGVMIAFFSLILTKITGNVIWDAIGSITIGALLGIIAIILIRKNRQYLIGMNIPEEIKERIIEILEADPSIDRVIDFKSSVLNIGIYHVKCEIEFNGTALMQETLKSIDLRETFDEWEGDYSEFVRFLVAFSGRVPRLMGTRIDTLEKRIQKEIPEIRHIDIEIN